MVSEDFLGRNPDIISYCEWKNGEGGRREIGKEEKAEC